MAYHWFRPSKDEREDFRAFPWRMRPVLHGKGCILQRLKEEQAQTWPRNGTLRKAEALKDSTDWKATADKLMQIQKEWKTIGAVPKKHSESLWQRFIDACDYFI